MIKVSVIIPAYNGESYLPRLLESIFSQGVKEDEYEIIIVDDCSTDKSVDLIKSFISTHSNIRLIQHPHNARLATACNTGLDNANGQYVWFIDQDDTITYNAMQMLLEKLIRHSPDVLLFNYNRVDQNEKVLESPVVFADSQVMPGIDFLNKYFRNSFECYLLGYRWRAIFSKSYFQDKGIRFIDGMMYDDTTVLLKSIFRADAVLSISKFCYNYRVNNSSITFFKGKRASLIYEFAFRIGKEVQTFADEVALYDISISSKLKDQAKSYYNYFFIDLLRTSSAERKRFYTIVRDNYKETKSVFHQLKTSRRIALLPIVGPLMISIVAFIYRMKHSRYGKRT